jgi:hypothetical protein
MKESFEAMVTIHDHDGEIQQITFSRLPARALPPTASGPARGSRPRRWSEFDVQAVISAIQSGVSVAHIARMHVVTRSAIYQMLLRRGLTVESLRPAVDKSGDV